jgi:hypothetical protein
VVWLAACEERRKGGGKARVAGALGVVVGRRAGFLVKQAMQQAHFGWRLVSISFVTEARAPVLTTLPSTKWRCLV